jgi:hypothetical protein|tara:strand:- start:179 stop:349 length:171 start_codon:yes stop_codon:yes gene_type:complete
MTDQEFEKYLKEIRELNAYLEAGNVQNKKVLDKIKIEMDTEFPNGFSVSLANSREI